MSPEDKIEKILDDTLAQVQFGSDDATKKMVTALSAYVNTFPNADGKFIMEGSAEYLQRINVIIAEAINNSAYPSAVAQCVRSIEEITELSQQVLTNYNPKVKIDFDKLGVSQIRMAQIETIVNNMTGDSLTAEIRQPIREALQRNVFAGSKLTDTRNYISDFLTKQEGQKYARLTRYAMTWAQDGILQYDGQIYDQSGTFTQIIQNSVGCDSIITLNLTLSTSTIDELIEATVIVYPNPTNDLLTIKLSSETNEDYVLIDSGGRKLIEGQLRGIQSQITLKELTVGLYFLQIGKERLTIRVVKQ
jgi:hypothetical protein